MTSRKDLKKRVRERQARTGERYTTALAEVLAEAPAPPKVPVVELVDLADAAARLGLVCRFAMFPDLAERVDGAAVLERLRGALLATESDPATELFRRAVLRGERVPGAAMSLDQVAEARRFMARARAGIGGASAGGQLLALHVEGKRGVETVVCVLWLSLLPVVVDREPLVLLVSPDGPFTAEELAKWRLR